MDGTEGDTDVPCFRIRREACTFHRPSPSLPYHTLPGRRYTRSIKHAGAESERPLVIVERSQANMRESITMTPWTHTRLQVQLLGFHTRAIFHLQGRSWRQHGHFPKSCPVEVWDGDMTCREILSPHIRVICLFLVIQYTTSLVICAVSAAGIQSTASSRSESGLTCDGRHTGVYLYHFESAQELPPP